LPALTSHSEYVAIAVQQENLCHASGAFGLAGEVAKETQMENEDGKLEYQAPELVVHGTIESLTQGQSSGWTLDATFPTGTPSGDITFS